MKTDFFSHPNLLAGRRLVPEFFQEQVQPEVLGPAVAASSSSGRTAPALVEAFAEIHRTLRCNASERAADAMLELVASRRTAR